MCQEIASYLGFQDGDVMSVHLCVLEMPTRPQHRNLALGFCSNQGPIAECSTSIGENDQRDSGSLWRDPLLGCGLEKQPS